MATLSPNAKQQFFDAAGNLAAGFKLYTYLTGTLTPQVTYADAGAVGNNANPIILDARGEAVIYLDPTITYRYVLTNAADVQQWLRDGVSALAGDAAAVSFLQSGTNAVARTSQSKMRDRVSVTDFTGADPTGVTVSDAAFQSAINALPASGGEIDVPNGTWKLDTRPTFGTKSITWNIGAGCLFTGTVGGGHVEGTSWPRAQTNYTLVPFGVFAQVQTTAPTVLQAPASGIFEAIQPAAYAGNSVALYCGANGAGAGNVWSLNTLVQANVGATGTFHGIELDVNTFAAGALVKGLGISGVGTVNGDVAIEIQHGVGWDYGITLYDCVNGITIQGDVTTGITVGFTGGTGAAYAGKQLLNGNETVYLQRFTDAAPTGNFFRARDAANTADLFRVGVNGSVDAAGIVTAAGFTTTGTTDTFNMALRFAAPTVAAGVVGLGNAVGTTVGAAGGASALPATPAGYWTINVAGTNRKVPYYPV